MSTWKEAIGGAMLGGGNKHLERGYRGPALNDEVIAAICIVWSLCSVVHALANQNVCIRPWCRKRPPAGQLLCTQH